MNSKRAYLIVLLVLLSIEASGDLPQTPDGKIDFSGVWDFRTTTPLQAPVHLNNSEGFSEDEAAKFEAAAQEAWDVRVFGEPWSDRGRFLTEGLRASLIIEPLDGRLPTRTPYGQSLNQKWRKLMDASTTVNPEDRTVLERCIVASTLPLISSNFNNNVRILQTLNYVMLMAEMVHDVRVAPFSELSTLAVSSWNGQSRASWEGETLLIKTSGLRDYTTRIGTSDEMSIEERFTLLDADSLSYTYTVNDPKVFTAPWTARQTLKRLNGQIYEYACHEGNESLSAMLRGSRLSDDSR